MDAQIRNFRETKSLMFDDENLKTATSIEQVTTDILIFFLCGFVILFFIFIICVHKPQYVCFHFISNQMKVESLIERCYDRFEQLASLDHTLPYFYRKEHIRYLEQSLRLLSSSYECLDSSRPWMVYW